MKATNTKAARVFFIAIAAIAMVSVSNVAKAGNGEDSSEKPVAVQYLGTVNAQPIFQIDIQNAAAENLVISLENADGDVLYSQKVSETSFSKKIQLETTETEIKLNLYVYSPKTKSKQLYQINKVTKTIDDVAVNQLKF